MKIQPIKTRRMEASMLTLTEFLTESLPCIPENSILAITSKVVSLCEGNVLPMAGTDKDAVIMSEADCFVPKENNRYGVYLTIKESLLIPSAGVDESNTNGCYVLWPKDPQASVNVCWTFLRAHFGLKNIGVILTDSTVSPLRWGVMGRSVAYCGFRGLNSKVGQTDLFGRSFHMTQIAVADACAAAAVLCMGETDEQTPLALLEDMPFVEFTSAPPSKEELEALHIPKEEDLFGQILSAVPWQTIEKGE